MLSRNRDVSPVLCALAISGALHLAGCATDELDFDPSGTVPSFGGPPTKSDSNPRIAVFAQRRGHFVIGSDVCEGEFVNYRVEYRPGNLPPGTSVFLHRGEGEMRNECIGDGFCCNSEFVSWQAIDTFEMSPLPGGVYAIQTSVTVTRDAERECLLYPWEPANYVGELDFVFAQVRPGGTIWDTPSNGGYGSYYAAPIGRYDQFACGDE